MGLIDDERDAARRRRFERWDTTDGPSQVVRRAYRHPWLVIASVVAAFIALLAALATWLDGLDWLEFAFPAVFLVPLAIHVHSGADHLASWEAGESVGDEPGEPAESENPYERAQREIHGSLGTPMTDRMHEARARGLALLLFAGLVAGFVLFAVRVIQG